MQIVITGGTGLVGCAFKRHLPNSVYLSSKDVDLRNYRKTKNTLEQLNPECIIHLAGKVGGVNANFKQMGDFYTDNIKINTNVLEVAKNLKIKKVVSFLSTCIYPDKCTYPLTEDQIHSGEPHHTNFGYAYAKRMLEVQSRAYRQQYNCDFICVIPNNLYGENDSFDLENSHVLPAIIRKTYEAIINNTPLTIWGDGKIYREFTYADDIAKIVCKLINIDYNGAPLNIGNTQEYLLSDVIDSISKIMNFKGKIVYDINKPKGQLRKPSSNDKLLSIIKFNYTELNEGLQNTCNWFIKNYPKIKGIS